MNDKNLNQLKQHRTLILIIALILLTVVCISIGSLENSSSTRKTAVQKSTQQATTKPAERQVKGSAITLGAGTFTGGKDVTVGLYDVTPGTGQSGNFMVNGTNSYNEILGDDSTNGHVNKVRVKISANDKIQISDLSSVTFTPVTSAFITKHATATLYAGTFIVGEDVGAGRYVVTPGAGQSGNFMVDGTNSYNEILGDNSTNGHVPSVTVDLTKGDNITISGLSQVIFTPSN